MRLSNTVEVISKISRCGRESAKFLCPRNLAVSADNHIFVSDLLLGGRVQEITFLCRMKL